VERSRTSIFDAFRKKEHNQDQGIPMKSTIFFLFVSVAAVSSGTLGAQEQKPVPKDSVRVFIPGCSKGYMFTAGRRTEDSPGGSAVPEGMHLRMNGPKKTIAEIKGQEGSRIEITGLMKKGQAGQDGVGLGGGVRITGGPPQAAGGMMPGPGVSQTMIDVEGWRRVPGECPSR
jgi:hypothetical protein